MLAGEKQMTPEQVTLVQESFARVARIADQAAIASLMIEQAYGRPHAAERP